jgi:glycosyltransferase involved in cell wall biosynthesis
LQSAETHSIAIEAGGFADGPAQALRDYLVERGARVVTILHPLLPTDGTRHVIANYVEGKRVDERTVRLPVRPPLSFLLDPLVPVVPARVDAWFGFNPLACARGLAARQLGRAGSAFLWSVDFVPDRFGLGTAMTRAYDRLDRFCCLHADARVEVSETAREARVERHTLPPDSAPAHVIPMGSWLERVPTTPSDGFRGRRAVFLGHLVPGKGAELLLESLALLDDVSADIIGGGPLEATLRARASLLGLGNRVRFHGFVPEHEEVERILADAAIAIAPYTPKEATYTRYADPGKLKAYLAAGLPIVLTDVPPNAHELSRQAGAEITEYDATQIADAIRRGLASPDAWRARREAALSYARHFDWTTLFENGLAKLGLEP